MFKGIKFRIIKKTEGKSAIVETTYLSALSLAEFIYWNHSKIKSITVMFKDNPNKKVK